MPYRITKTYKNNFYHIYNRGNNKESIFFEQENYNFFLNRINKYFLDKVDLICYCLMPNHYHLLVSPNVNNAIEKIMHKLSVSYTKAINKRFGRVGHLFQDRYKIKLVPNNNYLLHLSRYIHLNPVRSNLVTEPKDWKFSSYNSFINIVEDKNLKSNIILDQFNSINDYINFVRSYNNKSYNLIKDVLFK